MSQATKGPTELFVLDVTAHRYVLDIDARKITLPAQHQLWGSFRQLAWGRFRSIQWGRF